ncbi:MAG: cell division protein FtsL [Acetobacteraceae bacterium]
MIRPFTLLAAALAVGSGYYLYQAKHRTKLLDDKIAAVEHRTASAVSRIAVLHAEWALENSPSRLADLAARYLLLTPMQPNQAVSMADLASRLPPPAVPGATPPALAEPDLAVLAGMEEPALYASVRYFLSAHGERHSPALPLAVAVAATAPPATAQSTPDPVDRARPLAVAEAPTVAFPHPSSPVPPAQASSPPGPALVARASSAAAHGALTAAESAPRQTLSSRAPVRPVVLEAAPERQPLGRPRAAPVLTSALGGAYPSLPPPAPLSGSH